MSAFVEYRVRPVTRYIVTRFEGADGPGTPCSCEQRGEYDTSAVAYEVAYALCQSEHQAAGTPPGDPAFQYPKRL